MPTLRLVKAPRRRSAPVLLQCPRCSGREFIETRQGVQIVGGKPRGGTKALICALCHRKGERIALA